VINPTVRSYSVRRYYDPATGQFISVDPAVDQTEAPYAYVGGDPVDGIDPAGLGCFLRIACGVQSAVANTLNPWSPSNPIRQWAASGSWTSDLLYLNPAYGAVVGYAAEAQAYENGCSSSQVAEYGLAGVIGLGLGAFGDEEVAAETVVGEDLSQLAKRRLAQRLGRIPTSSSPIAQGGSSVTGRWWEYLDSEGNLKIVVEHPDGSVHVGIPKPQSLHREGGPPKFYDYGPFGHVGG
jgi:hypothetical protein